MARSTFLYRNNSNGKSLSLLPYDSIVHTTPDPDVVADLGVFSVMANSPRMGHCQTALEAGERGRPKDGVKLKKSAVGKGQFSIAEVKR